jgi:predicted transcriptional regulator
LLLSILKAPFSPNVLQQGIKNEVFIIPIMVNEHFVLQCKQRNTRRLTMPSMSVRIPEDIEQKLTLLAESTGRTKSWITNQAIQDYLVRELWQINEIKDALNEADSGQFANKEEVQDVFSKWGVNAD